MPIYTGVDGVVKKSESVAVGVNGVTRDAAGGYLGNAGVIRPFLGKIEGLEYFRLSHGPAECAAFNSATGAWGALQSVPFPSLSGGSIEDYGTVSFDGASPRVIANDGKLLRYRGILYGVFAGGYERSLASLAFTHGCKMYFPASVVWRRLSGSGGSWSGTIILCGKNLIPAGYSSNTIYSVSTSSAASATSYDIYAGTSLRGGTAAADQFQLSLDLSTVTLDGVEYPIKLV